jgi:hypothetical protein
VTFLVQRGLAPRGLLYDYINANFEPAFAVGHFDFLVHRGRHIAPLMLADLLTPAPDVANDLGSEKMLLKFRSLLPPANAISSLELLPDNEAVPPLIMHEGNARAEIAETNSSGAPVRPPRRMTWPISVTDPSMIYIYYSGNREFNSVAPATIILRDKSGAEIGLARLAP